MSQDPSRLEAWLDRRSGQKHHGERVQFKFDDTDELERYCHRLYDLASTHGVHGHILDSGESRPGGSESAGLVSLAVPDTAVYQAVEIWLASMFPLNELCARSFAWFQDESLHPARQLFLDARASFDAAFLKYRERLREIHADVINSIH